MTYYFNKEVDFSFLEAISKVTEELKKEGFGILTEIDVRETMKKKLEVDFRNYKILGACNPSLAYRALQSEPNIGLMLPCNLVVQENNQGKVIVSAIDPVISMQGINNFDLAKIAEEVRIKLQNVINNL